MKAKLWPKCGHRRTRSNVRGVSASRPGGQCRQCYQLRQAERTAARSAARAAGQTEAPAADTSTARPGPGRPRRSTAEAELAGDPRRRPIAEQTVPVTPWLREPREYQRPDGSFIFDGSLNAP